MHRVREKLVTWNSSIPLHGSQAWRTPWSPERCSVPDIGIRVKGMRVAMPGRPGRSENSRSMGHQQGDRRTNEHGKGPGSVEAMLRGALEDDRGADVEQHADREGQCA